MARTLEEYSASLTMCRHARHRAECAVDAAGGAEPGIDIIVTYLGVVRLDCYSNISLMSSSSLELEDVPVLLLGMS